MSADRESIIRDVARTLFVVAWADGVERGELQGRGAGAWEDWLDVAPRTFVRRNLDPDGSGREARLGAPCYVTRVEVPDPDAEKAARALVDRFDAAQTAGPRPDGVPHIVDAAEIHAELSGTDRFAHCLAMHALGSGVGLEDDMPSGVRLPAWIRASVPPIEFSAHDLDPERYPRQSWDVGARVRVERPQGVGSWIPRGGEVVTLLEAAFPGGWDVFDVLRADGSEESVYGFQLVPLRADEVTP